MNVCFEEPRATDLDELEMVEFERDVRSSCAVADENQAC